MTDIATRQALAKAALKVAAQGSWDHVRLHDLAAAAGRPMGDFYPLNVADAFDCVDEYFDRAAEQGLATPDKASEARDRVFDAAMARFEAMEPHRKAVLVLDKANERDPLAQASAIARTARTARWLLALASEDAEGLGAVARAQSLAFVLRQARGAWAKDDAGDFAKTMAALDAGLKRSDSFFENVEKFTAGLRAPRPASAKSAGEAPPSGRPGQTRPE